MDLVPDALLAGRAADGDMAAFEALARRHGPLMRACARRVTTVHPARLLWQTITVAAAVRRHFSPQPVSVEVAIVHIGGDQSGTNEAAGAGGAAFAAQKM